MPLAHLILHSVLRGFADTLGVSGTAHELALGLWVKAPDPAGFAGAAGLGTGLAVVVALRARLFPALAEGWRALGRPSSFLSSARAREALSVVWIAAVSGLLGLGLRQAGAAPPSSPRNVAIGLGVTGLALLCAAYVSGTRGGTAARRAARAGGGSFSDVPTLVGATLAGAAHAFGVWPGVSRVSAAAAVLLAIGLRPARSLELALIATVPFFWMDLAASTSSGSPLGKGQVLVVALVAFLGGLAAVAALRALLARRALAALPLWMFPLACAIFAFGRAVEAP